MILVVGGAYQGKMDYVKAHYPEDYLLVPNYHLEIKKQLEEGQDPMEEAKRFVSCSSLLKLLDSDKRDIIIVCDEVGSGVVPMEAFDRQYREMTGRVCCYFAQEATEVVRVIAGIGTKIKAVS